MRVAVARALGELGDPGAVVPLAGSLGLASVIGPLAILPLLAGVGMMVAYYVREARKARGGEWYVGPDGGDYYIPGDVADPGGWLGDLFGGGEGGVGNGGGG